MRDLENAIDIAQSLAPAARTATANGTGVDLANYDGAVVVFAVGTITDGTHTPKIQESDDNSTFTDVAAADQIGTFANLASSTPQKVGYVGSKRYLRAVSTVTSATTGGVYGAVVVRGYARKQPR
jgi:hypothetical protein